MVRLLTGALAVVLFGCGLLFGDLLGSSNYPPLNASYARLSSYFLRNGSEVRALGFFHFLSALALLCFAGYLYRWLSDATEGRAVAALAFAGGATAAAFLLLSALIYRALAEPSVVRSLALVHALIVISYLAASDRRPSGAADRRRDGRRGNWRAAPTLDRLVGRRGRGGVGDLRCHAAGPDEQHLCAIRRPAACGDPRFSLDAHNQRPTSCSSMTTPCLGAVLHGGSRVTPALPRPTGALTQARAAEQHWARRGASRRAFVGRGRGFRAKRDLHLVVCKYRSSVKARLPLGRSQRATLAGI